MAVLDTRVLDSSAGTGVGGESFLVGRFTLKSVQFVFTSGSFLLQVSNDGSNWTTIGGAITGDAFFSTEDPTNPIPKAVKFIRVFSTTAGAVVATGHFHDPV